MYASLRPLLFALPPETAHKAALLALRSGLFPPAPAADSALQVHAFGQNFAHPLGLAAGFDKNAVAVKPLLRLGFSFVETGTVTPRPQAGNATPRIFRLREDSALINRMGFPNEGKEAALKRLRALPKNTGIVGVNIGKNKDSADATADYVECLRACAPYAAYIAVNISSPNTPGLRDLQDKSALSTLLSALMHTRAALPHFVPLLVKVAPDLTPAQIEDISESALLHAVDGLIISNTTLARPATLKSLHAQEAGGLSGAPLFAPSTEILRAFYRATQGRLPLIAAGGVDSAEAAYAKIRAGATLVQLYSALIYQGPGLVRRIVHELPDLLARDGFKRVSEAVGSER